MGWTCLSLFPSRGWTSVSLRGMRKPWKRRKERSTSSICMNTLCEGRVFFATVCVCLPCTETWLLIFWWGCSATAEVRPAGESLDLLKGSQGSGENVVSGNSRATWILTPLGLLSLLPSWAWTLQSFMGLRWREGRLSLRWAGRWWGSPMRQRVDGSPECASQQAMRGAASLFSVHFLFALAEF